MAMKAVLNVETYLHCSYDLRGTQHRLWPGLSPNPHLSDYGKVARNPGLIGKWQEKQLSSARTLQPIAVRFQMSRIYRPRRRFTRTDFTIASAQPFRSSPLPHSSREAHPHFPTTLPSAGRCGRHFGVGQKISELGVCLRRTLP